MLDLFIGPDDEGFPLTRVVTPFTMPPQRLVVLTYRFDDGLMVGLFATEAEAEAQAVKWVQEDYPTYEVETIADIRRLEENEDDVLPEDAGFFAIDICFLAPGETWRNI
jgi:hypothetical protein